MKYTVSFWTIFAGKCFAKFNFFTNIIRNFRFNSNPDPPTPTPLSEPLVCIRSSSQQDHTSECAYSYHLSPSGEIAGESFSFLSDVRAPDDDRQIDGWMWFFYFSFIIELCSNISQEYMEVMTNSHWTQWWTVCSYLETLNIQEKKEIKKVIKRMGGRLGVGSDPATNLPLAKNRPDRMYIKNFTIYFKVNLVVSKALKNCSYF